MENQFHLLKLHLTNQGGILELSLRECLQNLEAHREVICPYWTKEYLSYCLYANDFIYEKPMSFWSGPVLLNSIIVVIILSPCEYFRKSQTISFFEVIPYYWTQESLSYCSPSRIFKNLKQFDLLKQILTTERKNLRILPLSGTLKNLEQLQYLKRSLVTLHEYINSLIQQGTSLDIG